MDTIEIPRFRLPYPADAPTISDGPLASELLEEPRERRGEGVARREGRRVDASPAAPRALR